MGTREQHQQGLPINQAVKETLEALPSRELFAYWSNLLWKESMRPLIQQLFQVDLTMSESQILRHLHLHRRPLAISEVAEYLAITHSAASRAVDRLVDNEFVSRSENPTDRRQKQLQLTAKGTHLVHTLSDTFSSGMERLVARLSTQDQEQFRLLIAHIIATAPDAAGVPLASEPLQEKSM